MGSNFRTNIFRITLVLTLAALACKALPFFGSDPEVTFAVVGDVMGHEAQIRSAYDPATKTYKYDSVFNRLGNRISAADLGIANLEVTLPGKPEMYSGYPQFGSPDALVTALKDIGFDLLVTANNHSMDKGEAAALRTVKVVRDAGFLQTGTFDPRDYAERRILIVEKNEIRMAFLNYTYDTNGIAVTPGVIVNLIEKERIQKDFELARAAKPDVTIVLYHFGKEYLSAPDAYQKEWVEFAFQEGAQIVLGGHPHTLQPFERKVTRDRFGVEAERFVIYSLGNFVSNMQRRQVDGGIILNFAIQKKDDRIVIRKISYEPLWVYTPIIKGKMEFYLLPVMEYLDSKELDPNSMARMKQFLSDTQALLKQSMESTRDPVK